MEVKVGELVLVEYSSGLRKLTKVTEITPSGLIRIDGSLWNKNGRLRGEVGLGYSYFKCLTEEEYAEYLKEFKLNRIKRAIVKNIQSKVDDLEVQEVLEIAKILKVIKVGGADEKISDNSED